MNRRLEGVAKDVFIKKTRFKSLRYIGAKSTPVYPVNYFSSVGLSSQAISHTISYALAYGDIYVSADYQTANPVITTSYSSFVNLSGFASESSGIEVIGNITANAQYSATNIVKTVSYSSSITIAGQVQIEEDSGVVANISLDSSYDVLLLVKHTEYSSEVSVVPQVSSSATRVFKGKSL